MEAGRILESEAGPEAGAVGAAVQRLQLAEAELAGEPLPEVEPRGKNDRFSLGALLPCLTL